ncbi:MAG: hypothetical protein IPM71_06055 [Bacteroidota bacterium]|nr:MAG: hypothetical protein IPM71_06055 [Bacteroidota bacterium]
MTKKKITVAALAEELKLRLNKNQSIDCCKTELLSLASLAKEKMGKEMIEVNWKD